MTFFIKVWNDKTKAWEREQERFPTRKAADREIQKRGLANAWVEPDKKSSSAQSKSAA